METKKLLSIIIPALNEETGIKEVLLKIPKDKIKKLGFDVEVLVIDGNSQDKTAKIARKHNAKVIVEHRKGYGRAYKTGFVEAKGDIIATLDADDTYPAEKIPHLVEILLKENLDFISANRFDSMDIDAMSARNKFGNKILTKTMKLLYGLNIEDSQSGMWIFKKKILEKFNLTSDGMSFSEEIKLESFSNGFKWREIPVHYHVRRGEIKLCAWKDGFLNLIFLIKKKLKAN